jgi:hypothetical protein
MNKKVNEACKRMNNTFGEHVYVSKPSLRICQILIRQNYVRKPYMLNGTTVVAILICRKYNLVAFE